MIKNIDRLKILWYFLRNMECVDEEVLYRILSESTWLVGMYRYDSNGRFGADFLKFSKEVRVSPL